jgi:hypothetical protein
MSRDKTYLEEIARIASRDDQPYALTLAEIRDAISRWRYLPGERVTVHVKDEQEERG